MLAQTPSLLHKNMNGQRESKRDGDEKLVTTTPVHDMRAAEPTFSHSELAGAVIAEAKTDSTTGVVDGDEKPTWEEVIQSTTDVVTSLPAHEEPSLEVPHADGGLGLALQKKLCVHDDSYVDTRPSDDHECGFAAVLQIDALLQKSMLDMKKEMSEAVNMASAVQQSRMDSLEASIDAKLEAQFSEQGRTGERLGNLEQTIQRLEQLLLKSVKAGTAIGKLGDDR